MYYTNIILPRFSEECDYRYDHYVYSTWNCFISNKDHIYIDLAAAVSCSNDVVRDLVMHAVDISEMITGPRASGDMTNLFKKEVLQVFNPKMITITEDRPFRISLWSLLSSLNPEIV